MADGSIPPPPAASPADGYSKTMHLLSTAEHRGGVNSDLAFKGTLAFAGHYGGFRFIDLADPGAPVELADVHCNGPQGDVTVYGDLLFLSVGTPQSTEGCEGSSNVTATTAGAFEGVRVFDISDPAAPTFLKAVRTDCGSHTNTLAPGEGGTAYVYVASYPLAPVVTANIDTPDMDIWHSAAFTPDGEYVTFGDEYFGPAMEPYGALWTYSVADPSTALSHFRIPRAEPSTYHNFKYVPLADRYILVSSAYGSGTSVVDLTNPSAPKEVAHYDMQSNQWSTYWYNGLIVANDISRGLDTLRFSSPLVAGAKKLPMLNPQTQDYLLR